MTLVCEIAQMVEMIGDRGAIQCAAHLSGCSGDTEFEPVLLQTEAGEYGPVAVYTEAPAMAFSLQPGDLVRIGGVEMIIVDDTQLMPY